MACITKRRGRYVVDCYDQNGKRYRKTLLIGTNKDEAKKLLREIEDKIERRTFVTDKKTKTFQEVAKQWLEYKKTRCRETTWEMYGSHLRNHFDELDYRKINLITIATIEKFITSRQSGDMSLGSLRKILVTLNQIMSYAVRHRLIDFNPVRDVERPKAIGKPDESVEMKVLTPEQIRDLLDAEADLKYKTIFLVAIMTGMRQGEILGLKWSDIALEKKQIHVQRTFNHGRFFAPKTKGSIRKVDLSPALVRELAKWKLASERNDLNLVFPSKVGTPMECQKLMIRHFIPALKRAGAPRIRFHDLRHTYASLMIAQGENIKYIQNQLGHSSPTVTLNVYAHLMKDSNQEAVCKLENIIFKGTGHNLVTKAVKENQVGL